MDTAFFTLLIIGSSLVTSSTIFVVRKLARFLFKAAALGILQDTHIVNILSAFITVVVGFYILSSRYPLPLSASYSFVVTLLVSPTLLSFILLEILDYVENHYISRSILSFFSFPLSFMVGFAVEMTVQKIFNPVPESMPYVLLASTSLAYCGSIIFIWTKR